MIRIVFVLGVFFLSFPIVPAQANILEFFFPSLRTPPPDPSDTMIAPFADLPEGEANDVDKRVTLPENATPIDKPHRINEDMAVWITTVASEAMNFDAADFNEDLKTTEIYFDGFGRQQYREFLVEKNIQKVLDSNRYFIRSYVEGTPLLLNEGALEGRYRWLYRVPMVLSYMERGKATYEDVEPLNQRAVLTVQIGRSDKAKHEDAIWIERWSGTITPMDETEN